MSAPSPLDRQKLRTGWAAYGAPRARWRIGGEYERAVVRGSGGHVAYHDPDGIAWILEALRARTGWKAKDEDGNVVELSGDDASITLEPGGQVELSGAPWSRLDDLAAEVRANRDHLVDIARGHDLHWIAAGMTPFASVPDIPFVPKGRYRVMQSYLPQYGPKAHWMMKGTCSVQGNWDYADEEDCQRKFHVALDLAPLTTAMFANSPLHRGQATGFQSWRAWIWTRTDPARTGFPPGVRDRYSHDGWIDYLLDAPMMFTRVDGAWVPADGITFRTWMRDGIDGRFPSPTDWDLHQTSVFPEVRVKRTIEIRSADAVNVDLAVAFCAFWTGLLYGPGALVAARGVADRLLATGGGPEDRHLVAARSGLDARFGTLGAADLARELVTLARGGLVEIGENASLIEPLAARVDSGRSPARDVMDAYDRDPSPANVLRAFAY